MSTAKPAKGIPVSSKIPTSGRDSGTHSRSSSVSNLTSASDIHSETGDAMSENALDFKVDDRVWVNGTKPGCVKFLGKTQFAPGVWAGVLLDEPIGKNDGSVSGVKYFSCEPLKGIFARPQKLARSPGPISGSGDASNAGSPRGSTCSINITTPSNRGLPSASLQSSGTRVCSRLRIGERIMVSSTTGVKTGIVRFLGETDFAKGEWAGIELDEPVGKNDGSVAGKRYFSCAMKYGLFSPLHKVSRAGGTMTPRSTSSIRGTPIMRSTSRDSLSSSVSNSSKASSRVRLGVTALTNSKPKPRPGMGLMTTSRALEETLKEKEQHIEQLLKEHDLERIELARISVRCKEAETKCAELQKEQQGIETERKNLEEQLCADKRKLEDLQFQLEEEKIIKSDVEMHLEQQKNTVKRIEEFIGDKLDGKFINIKEILDGKENLSKIPENQETNYQANISSEKILALEANLKNALEEKNKTMKELDDLRTQLNDNEKQSENLNSSLTVTIQEKDDVISNLKSELSSQLEKVTKLMEDNKNLNEQIILHAAETKQHSDEVVKEFGEKIKLLSEDLNSKNSRLEEFENSMQEEDSKISLLEKSLETQVQQLAEMTNQNQSLQQTLALKDVELIEKLALQKSLEAEVTVLISQVDTEIPKHEEKILGLVKDIERLTCSLQEKEDELVLKQTEITNLSKNIEELSDSNSQMQTKLQETEENVSSVNEKNIEKIISLKNEIQLLMEEKEHIADKLQKELDVKQTDFEVLSQELETKKILLSEKEAHISQLNGTLGDKESEFLKIQAGLNEVKQNCEILTEEKANMIKTLKAKEKLVSDFEKQLQDSKNMLDEKNKEIEENKKSTNALQDVLRQKEEENIQLNSKLQLADQNVEMLNKDSSEHVMTLQNELSKLKDENTKAKNNLEQEIAQMQEEIKEMSTSISEKDNSLKEKDEIISVTQDQVKIKESDVSNLSCQIEKLEKELSTLSNSNKDLMEKHEKQISVFKEEFSCELKKKEVKLAEIQEENKKLSSTISETNCSLEENKGSSYILQNQLKDKENEVCKLSEKAKKLDQELDALSKDKEEIQLSLEKQLQAVKNELNMELKKRDEVLNEGQTKLSESNELLEAKDAELQQKESVITSLKAVVTEKESQFDELSQMIESSQAQLKKLEEQNQSNLKLLESKETFINVFKAEKEKHLFTLQENYKQEKSQFEEAVKRHEGEIRDKDYIIVKLNAEAEEQKKVIEVMHEELKSTKASNETAAQNSNEVHKGFIAKIAELEDKYTKLLEEKKKVEDEENRAKGEKKDLEAARDSLLKEKVQQEVVVKDKEAKLEALQAEVTRMQIEFTRHKQELEQKLDVSEMEKEGALELKSQLELQHSVLEELQQELQNLDKENKYLELKLKEMSNLSSENTELHNKLNEFEKLDKEKSERILNMEEKYQALEDSLENTRNSLRVKEVECLSLGSKMPNSESDKDSKENLKLSLKSLEQENILLKHKIEKLELAPEKKLSGPSVDNGSQMDSEERESLISQIDFLNSIIVDMKQKNENLQQDIEVFKMGPLELDSNLNDVKKKLAPRLFCDICDMFDLHDTDDCPKQSSFIEDEAVPHLIPQGARKLEERPYCNNCEVFGHWTLDCEEQETY